MDVKEVIKSQYHASLEMLKRAVEKCPESLWADPEPKNKFWHIAFHALFYTHLYLQDSEKDFTPWAKHRAMYNFTGPVPWPPHEIPKIGEPYSKPEVLEYLEFCQKEVDKRVPGLNLDSESGFPWKPFNKLELQIESIRHIDYHAGQLIDRMRTKHGIKMGG
jgi:hypothetical protein